MIVAPPVLIEDGNEHGIAPIRRLTEHHRHARPFAAELAVVEVSPSQGLLSLLGPNIPC